uniref:Integrase catalytic domain-containing protein n=1 Tax=Heterorhabditis bacteriophora TaxID=37862 RepID=A0A1I7XN16_HETBA
MGYTNCPHAGKKSLIIMAIISFNKVLMSNKLMMKGLCEDCNTTKCKFIPTESLIPKSSGLTKSSTPRSEGLNTLKTGNGIPEQNEDIKEKDKILLEKTYYSPFSGFCGINELQRATKRPIKEVKEFLNQQDVYTLHKPARKNYPSQRVYFNRIDEQWQADLVEMQMYADENDGFRYLLTIIDCFSKYAWVVPIKKKTSSLTQDAFKSIFSQGRKPTKIQTDNGKEFYNKEMQVFFKSLDIHHFSTYSDKKASIVERFNRTLKEKMWKIFTHNGNHKWIDILDDLLQGYNNRYHTSIKMTPEEANVVYQNLFPSKDLEDHREDQQRSTTKFKVGDTVRITKYKSIFAKGYLPNWSTEQFKISDVHHGKVVMYSLKDLADEEIKGKFYEQELTLFNNISEEYKVEEVLKHRTRNGKKEMFVKWYGYPDKFNSWIAASDIIKKT